MSGSLSLPNRVLVAETSCEMWNDYLDRALVVPTLAERDATFFPDAGFV